MDAYDAIIAGTGAGRGTLARHLAPSGKRVLLLERGDWLLRELPLVRRLHEERDPGRCAHQAGTCRFGMDPVTRMGWTEASSLNTHERRCASASATVRGGRDGQVGPAAPDGGLVQNLPVRIVDVSRALLAAGVLALLVASSGHAGYARDRLPGDVQQVKMIGFTVTDADREADFFTKVLRFEKVADFRVVGSEYGKMEGVFNANMRIVHLKLGDQIVELTQYVSPPTGRPIPVPSYSNDEWFEHMAIVVNDMDAAYKILQENNVQQISAYPITIPQTNLGAAGIKAIKFHDPERHDLELLYFPLGKGDPSWQKPTNKLFLGLSHTAMTVANTEEGVRFYRDLLGLEVGGVTFNTGETQEVLDNLFNDTCRVTEIVPVSAPPHIEFLDYKTPPGGRPMPVDTKANDLWHWQTSLVTKDIQAVTGRLREAGVQFITPDVVTIPEEAQAQLGFKKALMVRDPNGHAIRLIEE